MRLPGLGFLLLALALAGASCGGNSDAPATPATATPGGCPVETELCVFGDEVARWVAANDVNAIVEGSNFDDTAGRSTVIGSIAAALGQSAAPRNTAIGCPVVDGADRCDRGFVLVLTTLDSGETDPGRGQMLLLGFAQNEPTRPSLTGVGIPETAATRSAALRGGIAADCTIPVGLKPASQAEECLPVNFKLR